MCVTCGCSDEAHVTITDLDDALQAHTHTLADGTVIHHSHGDSHDHHHSHSRNHRSHHSHSSDHSADYPHAVNLLNSLASAQIHADIHSTTVSLEHNILAKNNLIAAQNRGWLKGRNTIALNLVSSPGAGKTTLLTRTITDLQPEIPIHVIEGDQETINDARRIQETGCRVVQINTGTGCHLEAAMVEQGLRQLNPPLHSIVMIENVGNLVCPALFDLGEHAKVAILSVTEGEDKPIKYPHMFRVSDVMILTKLDLLPYLAFDVERCLDYARQVNPQIQIFQVSATTGTGLDRWYDWLRAIWQAKE